MADAKTAVSSNPKTLWRRSRLKRVPNRRSIMAATRMASPTLDNAKMAAATKLRSPNILATIDAVAAPIDTAHREPRPSAINAPAATPLAGQNTATPSGSLSR